jgi:hypothetical protein
MKNALAYGAIAAIASVMVLTSPARAQDADGPHVNDAGEFCAPAEKLMQKAHEIFGEHVTWTGKNADGFRFVLMTSDKTWSLFMIDNKPGDDGQFDACLKASDGNPPPAKGA